MLRLLGVSKRQLRSWEDQNLVSSGGSFTFSDILVLRMLIGLRKSKVSAAQIRLATEAIKRKLGDLHSPLSEVRIYSQGKKIEVQFAGKRMEPISGQLLLDFDEAEIKSCCPFPAKASRLQSPRRKPGGRPNTGSSAAWNWNRPARLWRTLSMRTARPATWTQARRAPW